MSVATIETPGEVFDAKALLTRCLGNAQFARRVLATSRERVGSDLSELEQRMANLDTLAVARLAHRIKGACGSVAAVRAADHAAVLEQLALEGSPDRLPAQVSLLRHAWSRFVAASSTTDW